MLRKIGAILQTPATLAGAAIGLVCYLLTGRHPSIRLLELLGFLVVATFAAAVSVALWGVYDWYNSPWEQCKRAAEEQGGVCQLTFGVIP